METKHTPGPWRADEEGCVVSDAGMICDVGFMNVNPEANARLIAAAPDLLRELKCFVQYAQAHPRGCRYSRLKEALAAIAKAEKGE